MNTLAPLVASSGASIILAEAGLAEGVATAKNARERPRLEAGRAEVRLRDGLRNALHAANQAVISSTQLLGR